MLFCYEYCQDILFPLFQAFLQWFLWACISIVVLLYHWQINFFNTGTTFLTVKFRKSSAIISFNISHVSVSLLSLWFSHHLYLYLFTAVDVFLRFCSFLCIPLSQRYRLIFNLADSFFCQLTCTVGTHYIMLFKYRTFTFLFIMSIFFFLLYKISFYLEFIICSHNVESKNEALYFVGYLSRVFEVKFWKQRSM